MKLAAIVGALGLSLALAAPAQASCAWFQPGDQDNSVCGPPPFNETAQNALNNLHNNFSPTQAANNFKQAMNDNFNPANLKKNLGLGG